MIPTWREDRLMQNRIAAFLVRRFNSRWYRALLGNGEETERVALLRDSLEAVRRGELTPLDAVKMEMELNHRLQPPGPPEPRDPWFGRKPPFSDHPLDADLCRFAAKVLG
jgi:hypothetical protein